MRNRLKNAATAFRANWSISELDALMDAAIHGEPSKTGVDISGSTAMNYSAVFCAVNIIAGTIASLPLQLYVRVGDGGKRIYRDHPLYDVLHDRPNPEMTSYVFREILQSHLLLWGNAYAEIVPDRLGRPLELWPWNPSAVQIRRDDDQKIYYEIRESHSGMRTVPAQYMFHIPGMSFDGRVGYSIISKARETFGLGLAMEEFQARFYGQGTNVGGVLQHPAKLSDEAHARLVKDVEEKRSGLKNAHTTMILEEGMKLEKTTMPLEDAQFLESKVFQIGEIARWFNLPPHKLKDLSNATYSNIEEQQIEFVQDSIRPWAVRWEQHVAWKLLREEERRTLFAEFNLDGLQRGDFKARMEGYALGRNIGIMSANDIRARENMNPVEGLAGTMLWRPLNMGDAAAAPESQSDTEEDSLRVVQ